MLCIQLYLSTNVQSLAKRHPSIGTALHRYLPITIDIPHPDPRAYSLRWQRHRRSRRRCCLTRYAEMRLGWHPVHRRHLHSHRPIACRCLKRCNVHWHWHWRWRGGSRLRCGRWQGRWRGLCVLHRHRLSWSSLHLHWLLMRGDADTGRLRRLDGCRDRCGLAVGLYLRARAGRGRRGIRHVLLQMRGRCSLLCRRGMWRLLDWSAIDDPV